MTANIDIKKLKEQITILSEVVDSIAKKFHAENNPKRKSELRDKLARVHTSMSEFWLVHSMELHRLAEEERKEHSAFCRVCEILREYGQSYCPCPEIPCKKNMKRTANFIDEYKENCTLIKKATHGYVVETDAPVSEYVCGICMARGMAGCGG